MATKGSLVVFFKSKYAITYNPSNVLLGCFIRFKDSIHGRTQHTDPGIGERQNSLLLTGPKEKATQGVVA